LCQPPAGDNFSGIQLCFCNFDDNEKLGNTMSILRSSLIISGLSVLVAGPVLADRTDDREAIAEVMWHYARALDTGDADAYAATYTEDGEFTAGATSTKGKQALHDMIAGLNGATGLYHMNADTWVEFIDDTHAIHHSYWLTMRRAAGDQPAGVVAVGVGADQMVKVNGKWLIKVRNVNADQ
jgi:uncharacterized protein (TIGR02246 family)